MYNFKRRCLLLVSLLFTLFPALTLQHNGSTVDYMLSSYLCKDCATPQGDKDLCWGYEKGCNNKRRLFIPQCEKPDKSR